MSEWDALEQAARAAIDGRTDPPTEASILAGIDFAVLASPDVILRLIAAVREAEREGWDAALSAVRRELYVTRYDDADAVLDRLASEGAR